MRTFTITVQGERVTVFRAEGTGCSFGDSRDLAVALSTIPRGLDERLGLITESIVMARRHCIEAASIAAAIAKGNEIADAEDARMSEGSAT